MIRVTPQLNNILLLRAIAIILVCLIHLAMVANFKTSGVLQAIINEGQSGVSIFFIISGFILPYSLHKRSYKLKDYWKFLAGRIIRIDPPYWASIILIFLFGAQPLSAINTQTIFLHLTYLVPFIKNAKWFSEIYWTLSIEFQYYILIGLTYPFLMRIKPLYAVCLAILPAIVFIALHLNYRGIIVTNFYNFTMGFIAFLGFIKKINYKQLWISLILFSVYTMYSVSIKSGAYSLLSVTFILLVSNKNHYSPINFIGSISYSLYLIHVPISVLIVSYISKYISNTWYLFIISFMSSIFLAWLFYIAIEKPFIRLSKKVNSK